MPQKKRFLTTVMVAVLFILSGCYKDRTVPNLDNGSTITKQVSFASDIIPIFNSSCNMSGCHSSGGHSPNLIAANAYSSLTNGNYIDLDTPENSPIYLWMTGKKSTPMPVGGMNTTYNSLVLAWIKQGAKNN
jgi:hypothetical protein